MAQVLSPSLPLDRSIMLAISNALGERPVRVRALETPQGRLWLKRVEQLSLRWRLQKGNSRVLFEKDRAGLHLLADAGLPVAPILAEGPDYFVTPDLGTTLRAMLDAGVAKDERLRAFDGAGRALAALHATGYSHGRPAVRDLCWDGEKVRFIDLEKFSARRHSPRHFAADMLIFLHSIFAGSGNAEDADAAVAAYRQAAGEERWNRVQRLAGQLAFARPMAYGLLGFLKHGRDLRAMIATLDYLATIR
ncbi:MAG: serine/threonine protein phosphatase [Cereibacter sphaeroides]|uniref:Serine/threonine protein phosphatase n=1 Tax=Cereibacter sphaeroides TaxID=1063 RepID=A0A2W5TLJ2_CERSP|nr:MAG: serine/threonine protein phosphatase [Cereibacter sphaeroides]